ncbi:MAG: hypothetical protein V3S10_05190 [Dehalococcoidales bacterium]
MNYMTRSVRAFAQILGAVIGGGIASPTDEALRQYPYLGYYR